MMIPAPRVPENNSWKCPEKDCDGFYQPYGDGSLSCYQGHLSRLSLDDVEIPDMVYLPVMEDC